MNHLPAQYRPKDHEERIFRLWTDAHAFHADPRRVLDRQAQPFAVLIPPPNVTAALHLGHALNNTLQDVLVRAHRMMGHETLWMPGTDHAGIATQTVVEKRLLATEGKRRTDYARHEFLQRVQDFKDEYEARITEQLKRLGCSCDWPRQRFTMDPVCARAVRHAFFILFRDGLIYRGKRLVNWDPATQTALADDEVESVEVQGHFWYLRYPLVHPPGNPEDPFDAQEVTWSELAARGYPDADQRPDDQPAWITVATTRPETYLGDTAVAVNPKDPRARPLRGLCVQLPIVGRIIPIIEDDYVVLPDADDPKARFTTGFLKVTPAHDPNDWEIGRRHNLPVINVFAPDASVSDRHGWDRAARGEGGNIFIGKSREQARDLVIREFKDRNLLEDVRPCTHAVGHSYRSHVPVEPYLSDQWFVRVTDDRLAGAAQRALDHGLLRFIPDRYAKTYQQWHEHLRDWCISRQLWWGHRIPVWHRSITIPKGHDPAAILEPLGLAALLSDDLPGAALRAQDADGNDLPRDRLLRTDPDSDRSVHLFVCTDGSDPDLDQRLEHAGFEQDPDVLDTWFSSALWPLSTMGWPDPAQAARDTGIDDFPQLLDAFNPTSALCTAREIITLWVSRMVMFNRYFLAPRDNTTPGNARVPFHDVFIHPVIQDGQGQKMSKSLGNGVDPLDIVRSHGADALRFSMCQLATATQDVRMPLDPVCPHCDHTFQAALTQTPAGHTVHAPRQTCPACNRDMITPFGLFAGHEPSPDAPLCRLTSPRFDAARNFCNKLWNAARFAISTLADQPAEPVYDPAKLPLPDRWILARLHDAAHAAADAITSYQFATCAQTLYDLLWRDFCDWYIEALKPTIAHNPHQRAVLRASLDAILRLLHPVLPFITEALYQHLRQIPLTHVAGLSLPDPRKHGTLCTAPWPAVDPALRHEPTLRRFQRLQRITTDIRELRAHHSVKPRQRITLHAPADLASEIESAAPIVHALAGLRAVSTAQPPPDAAACTIAGTHAHLADLTDSLDAHAHRAALQRQLEQIDKRIAALKARLANENYLKKAPPHLVQQTREQLDEALAQRRAALDALHAHS